MDNQENLFDNEKLNYSMEEINKMSGVEFEKLIKILSEKMGFETQMTKITGDGGIDLILYNYQPFLSGKYIIQCKRWKGNVGSAVIREIYGVVSDERANKGIVITTSNFTPNAIKFAANKPIELINGNKLNELLNHYVLSKGELELIKSEPKTKRKVTIRDVEAAMQKDSSLIPYRQFIKNRNSLRGITYK